MNKIFVGGLSWNTDDDSLKEAFESIGEVGNVVDSLCENQIYQSQDFALVRVGDAWNELERRAASLGEATPYEVVGRRIRRLVSWDECPTFSFCMLLSIQLLYRRWAKQFVFRNSSNFEFSAFLDFS